MASIIFPTLMLLILAAVERIGRKVQAEPNPIAYDDDLRELLNLAALRRLRQGYDYTVECETQAEHNTCMYFVCLHDLTYDWHPDSGEFVIHPPG